MLFNMLVFILKSASVFEETKLSSGKWMNKWWYIHKWSIVSSQKKGTFKPCKDTEELETHSIK